MPYTVNYTDNQNKTPIIVYDNTANIDTSLTFPGRNINSYGQIIAENFLALLENFASETPPIAPTEGQIWFNSQSAVSTLLIWDGSSWKSASGIQKSPIRPGVDQSKVGELWVDTVNQQLYVFSGTDWILIGPNFSTGLKSGLIVEQIIDSDDVSRVVLLVYVEDRPIIIISKDSFTPKITIPQFPRISSGISIAAPDGNISAETEIYFGNKLPKLYGVAEAADALVINQSSVPASKFLRSDIFNIVDDAFSIKSDAGLSIGADSIFNISASANAVKFFNNLAGSALDFQLNLSGLATTVLRIIDGKVGINTTAPTEALELTGNAIINGNLIVNSTTAATNTNAGAVKILGGVVVSKNLIIRDQLTVDSTSFLADATPQITDRYELGSVTRRWNAVRTKTLIADTIQGVLDGSISGNASTATSLQQQTTFQLIGDITAPSFQFNGVTGGTTKTFDTRISPAFVTSKQDIATLISPQKSVSLKDDFVLVYRPSLSGLYRASRDTFVGDLGVPLGGIMPYAGTASPAGYLFCDGSEVLISKYNELFQIIGSTYNGSVPLAGQDTFRLPDLRGRFPLGKDNMDNGEQVQTPAGSIIDGGGGNADRVSGVSPDTLGGVGGSSEYTLAVSNLPNHEHSLQGSTGQQFYAARLDSTVPLDSGAFLGAGGTTNNRAQYLPTSGNIRTGGVVGQPFTAMNPFLTVFYIIRSGPTSF